MTAKTGNLKHPVKASWIRELGCRLDAPPFVSGALEARKTLEALNVRKDRLDTLTENGINGIYHAGREGRTWVNSREYGVPFLGSSDILSADLSRLPLMSKKQIALTPQFIIREGWTLITRSGTIGRTAYCRPEMDGLACSEHVMRVVPDELRVPPGYLYAFISSKFGIPIVVSGTYGSIIQSIEPQHIATLPVPRFGKKREDRVQLLISESAKKRSEAGNLRERLIASVEQYLGWESKTLDLRPSVVSSVLVTRRLDGFYHSPTVGQARDIFASHRESKLVGDVVERIFEPNRGARRKVDDLTFGVPFLSSSSVFRIEPTADYLVSKRMPHLDSLLLKDCDVLLPRSGQLGGIIGRAVLPLQSNLGSAASEHLVRIRCRTNDDAHYVWALFASQAGYYAAIGTAFGTSIPSLDCDLLGQLSIPWNTGKIRQRFIERSKEIHSLLNDAIFLEREAIALVERAIEENA